MAITTIQLNVETKKELDKLKISSRDTYNDVIEMLIEDSMELSEQTKRELEEARMEIERGKFYTHEEVKKKLGL